MRPRPGNHPGRAENLSRECCDRLQVRRLRVGEVLFGYLKRKTAHSRPNLVTIFCVLVCQAWFAKQAGRQIDAGIRSACPGYAISPAGRAASRSTYSLSCRHQAEGLYFGQKLQRSHRAMFGWRQRNSASASQRLPRGAGAALHFGLEAQHEFAVLERFFNLLARHLEHTPAAAPGRCLRPSKLKSVPTHSRLSKLASLSTSSACCCCAAKRDRAAIMTPKTSALSPPSGTQRFPWLISASVRTTMRRDWPPLALQNVAVEAKSSR